MDMETQNLESLSLLCPYGYQVRKCGYCKGENSSPAYFAGSSRMLPETYQILMDRGWRRSGRLFYKPDVARACCPQFTIRLPADEFRPNKDQRQTLNRWNRHVLGEKYINEKARRQTKESKKADRNQFDLPKTVHAAEVYTLLDDLESAHVLDVTLEHDDYSDEKFDLYENYQLRVHNDVPDEVCESVFESFLCRSPLQRKDSGLGPRLGSWHQCYRLNERLIAMAVLDLLPDAVSAVYFMYHSDFEQWSFGKLSAMREITFALENGYRYYYMGYYIAGCQKMRYKADYKPQHFLDPIEHRWEPLEGTVKSFVDTGGYSVRNCADLPMTPEVDKIYGGFSFDPAPVSSKSGREAHLGGPFTSQTGQVWYIKDAEGVEKSARALHTCGMPGVLSLTDLIRLLPSGNLTDGELALPLAWVPVRIGRHCTIRVGQVAAWDDTPGVQYLMQLCDKGSFMGTVADLVACCGGDAMTSIAVDMAHGEFQA